MIDRIFEQLPSQQFHRFIHCINISCIFPIRPPIVQNTKVSRCLAIRTELSRTPGSISVYASVNSISDLEAIHRFELHERCRNLNNSLGIYVKIASLSAKLIGYSIMQMASVTRLISRVQHYVSMHFNFNCLNFPRFSIKILPKVSFVFFIERRVKLSEKKANLCH